jgi:hypothetical protein
MAMEDIKAEGLPVRYSKIPIHRKHVVRNKYVRLQGGLCWFCDAKLEGPPPPKIADKKIRPELYPPGFFNHPVHLQHNHQSDLTEGAVHAHCNAVLWEYHHR